MITKVLWKEFKQISLVKEESIWNFEATPSELALDFIIRVIVTPFCIAFDLILMLFEIIYYITKKYYERKLEKENK